MKIKCIFTMIVLALFSNVLFAKNQITNYSALISTLKNGETVHAVIDVDKCKYANGGTNQWDEKTRGFRIEDVYERSAPDIASGKKMRLIAASTHDYVGSQREGMNIARSLLRVFENGNVEVIDQMFSMETAKFGDESVLLCHLSKDGSGGVMLTAK